MKILKLETFKTPEELIEFINKNKIEKSNIQHVDIVHGLNKMCSLTYWAYDTGIVTGSTMTLVGERGPEVIFPLKLEKKDDPIL